MARPRVLHATDISTTVLLTNIIRKERIAYCSKQTLTRTMLMGRLGRRNQPLYCSRRRTRRTFTKYQSTNRCTPAMNPHAPTTAVHSKPASSAAEKGERNRLSNAPNPPVSSSRTLPMTLWYTDVLRGCFYKDREININSATEIIAVCAIDLGARITIADYKVNNAYACARY